MVKGAGKKNRNNGIDKRRRGLKKKNNNSIDKDDYENNFKAKHANKNLDLSLSAKNLSSSTLDRSKEFLDPKSDSLDFKKNDKLENNDKLKKNNTSNKRKRHNRRRKHKKAIKQEKNNKFNKSTNDGKDKIVKEYGDNKFINDDKNNIESKSINNSKNNIINKSDQDAKNGNYKDSVYYKNNTNKENNTDNENDINIKDYIDNENYVDFVNDINVNDYIENIDNKGNIDNKDNKNNIGLDNNTNNNSVVNSQYGTSFLPFSLPALPEISASLDFTSNYYRYLSQIIKSTPVDQIQQKFPSTNSLFPILQNVSNLNEFDKQVDNNEDVFRSPSPSLSGSLSPLYTSTPRSRSGTPFFGSFADYKNGKSFNENKSKWSKEEVKLLQQLILEDFLKKNKDPNILFPTAYDVNWNMLSQRLERPAQGVYSKARRMNFIEKSQRRGKKYQKIIADRLLEKEDLKKSKKHHGKFSSENLKGDDQNLNDLHEKDNNSLKSSIPGYDSFYDGKNTTKNDLSSNLWNEEMLDKNSPENEAHDTENSSPFNSPISAKKHKIIKPKSILPFTSFMKTSKDKSEMRSSEISSSHIQNNYNSDDAKDSILVKNSSVNDHNNDALRHAYSTITTDNEEKFVSNRIITSDHNDSSTSTFILNKNSDSNISQPEVLDLQNKSDSYISDSESIDSIFFKAADSDSSYSDSLYSESSYSSDD